MLIERRALLKKIEWKTLGPLENIDNYVLAIPQKRNLPKRIRFVRVLRGIIDSYPISFQI
jgi:hypothetical protein